MPNLRTAALSLAVVLVLIAANAVAAHAGTTNVITAIKAADAKIRRLPANKDLDAHLNVTTAMEAEKLAPEIGPLVKASDRAIAVVAKSTTSTSRQRRGKTKWIKASKEQERGLLQYRTALEDLAAGKKAAFKTQDAKATKLIGASLMMSASADKLLGISANY